MNKREYQGWTPSDLIRSSKSANRIFEKFAESSKRGHSDFVPPVFRGYDWEPETPESTLPSYLAVRRREKFIRKEFGIESFGFSNSLLMFYLSLKRLWSNNHRCPQLGALLVWWRVSKRPKIWRIWHVLKSRLLEIFENLIYEIIGNFRKFIFKRYKNDMIAKPCHDGCRGGSGFHYPLYKVRKTEIKISNLIFRILNYFYFSGG